MSRKNFWPFASVTVCLAKHGTFSNICTALFFYVKIWTEMPVSRIPKTRKGEKGLFFHKREFIPRKPYANDSLGTVRICFYVVLKYFKVKNTVKVVRWRFCPAVPMRRRLEFERDPRVSIRLTQTKVSPHT